MGIRANFKLTWEQAVIAACTQPDIEVIADQRIIINPVHVGDRQIAELVLLYGQYNTPCLITARFQAKALVIPAILHIAEQKERLAKEGILCNVNFTGGLVTVVYSQQSWWESMLAQQEAKRQAQTQSEGSTE